MKIRQRLTLWFTGLVGLIVGTGATLGWLGVRNQIYSLSRSEIHDKQTEVQAFIDGISHEFARQHLSFDLLRNADSLKEIFDNDQTSLYTNIFIQITDLQGQIISQSSNLARRALPVDRGAALNQQDLQPLSLQLPKGQVLVLYANSNLLVNGKPQGFLQLGLSTEKNEKLLQQLLLYEISGLIFSLLISLLLGGFLAERALRPMLKITGQVQQMAGQDLFRHLDVSQLSQDEIGILAQTFNGLLQRIEELFKAQQQFITDASHEFRTPLTAIRGHAQLIEKRGQDDVIRLRSSATIIRESRRLGRLVDDLLLLARLESQASRLEKLELSELVQEVYEDLEPLRPQLKLELKDAQLPVMGHPDSIRRVLVNLLSNAFAALSGKPDDLVLLSCSRRGHLAEVVVQDSGHGIPAEHLPKIFDRFYRVDTDRNRDTGGSGIGLALVYEIMRLNQGKVDVQSTPGQGTRFILHFPLVFPSTGATSRI